MSGWAGPGCDESLDDDQAEVPVRMSDVAAQGLVARGRPRVQGPDEAWHEGRHGRRGRLQPCGHRGHDRVSQPARGRRRRRQGARIAEGRDHRLDRGPVAGPDRVERGGTHGRVGITEERRGRRPVLATEHLEGERGA